MAYALAFFPIAFVDFVFFAVLALIDVLTLTAAYGFLPDRVLAETGAFRVDTIVLI